MKRPISILCLADIHYEEAGDMAGVDSLCKELKTYTAKNAENAKWHPDYIVIAGDIANKNEGYAGGKEFIQKLIEGFGIQPEGVIMVPGNHDNTRAVTKEEMDSQKKTFIQYCKEQSETTIQEFGEIFEPKFHDYLDFNKDYITSCTDSEFYSLYSPEVLDNRLKGLSGVKFFKKDHLCFVYVNTEWLYLVDKRKAKVLSAGKEEDITDFVNVDENCCLCSPLIKDAYRKIKNDYPDYTVVTVMHRGFDHFPLEEKNISDMGKIDSIAYIKRYSDIIITGHDHVLRPAPPTLIDNRVQYFQLGSVGRKETLVSELSRFAEVIRIDVPQGSIEQLFIQYKNDSHDSQWFFYPSDRKYPLYTKYQYENLVLSRYSHTILRVPSISKEDIERTISLYFKFPEKDTLIVLANELNNEEQRKAVKDFIKIGEDKRYVVVYHDYLNYDEKVKSILDKIRDDIIKQILLNKAVIEEVLVEYPIWDNDEDLYVKKI